MRFIENIHSDIEMSNEYNCPDCNSWNIEYFSEYHNDEDGVIEIEYCCNNCGNYFIVEELK